MSIRAKRTGTTVVMGTLLFSAMSLTAQESQKAAEAPKKKISISAKAPAPDAEESKVITLTVHARRSAQQLVPRVQRASHFNQRLDSAPKESVLALEVKGEPLRFADLPQTSQKQLKAQFGADAATRYESGIALQLMNIVNRARKKQPSAQIGLFNISTSNSAAARGKTPPSYSKLIAAVDLVLPAAKKSVRPAASSSTDSTSKKPNRSQSPRYSSSIAKSEYLTVCGGHSN